MSEIINILSSKIYHSSSAYIFLFLLLILHHQLFSKVFRADFSFVLLFKRSQFYSLLGRELEAIYYMVFLGVHAREIDVLTPNIASKNRFALCVVPGDSRIGYSGSSHRSHLHFFKIFDIYSEIFIIKGGGG